MPPRRRTIDTIKAHAVRYAGVVMVSVITFATSFLWTQQWRNAQAEERARSDDEFKAQQIKARDRELDDLKARVLHLEERCK